MNPFLVGSILRIRAKGIMITSFVARTVKVVIVQVLR